MFSGSWWWWSWWSSSIPWPHVVAEYFCFVSIIYILEFVSVYIPSYRLNSGTDWTFYSWLATSLGKQLWIPNRMEVSSEPLHYLFSEQSWQCRFYRNYENGAAESHDFLHQERTWHFMCFVYIIVRLCVRIYEYACDNEINVNVFLSVCKR